MSFTGPFSFNLLASQEEVAIIHDGRVLLMKNPVISSVNYHMDAARFTEHTMAGEKLKYPPKEIEVTVSLVANEWVEGKEQDMQRQLPEAVDDMDVEELLAAVNQKLDQRDNEI